MSDAPLFICNEGDFHEEFGYICIQKRLDFLARLEGQSRAAQVEECILAGENRVEVPFAPGDPRRIVYTVPTWRREPIRRLRVEWARWKVRHR